MGGDNAPDEIVKGCIEASKLKEGLEIEIIGRESEIRRVLKKYLMKMNRILVTTHRLYTEDQKQKR